MRAYISSITGNTRKIADHILGWMEAHPQITDSLPEDLVLLFFWCRKSSLDPQSLKILEELKDQRILAFGTMGYYPESEYGDLVRSHVKELVNKNNTCLGIFLCQGKIPEEHTEKRRALPTTSRHYLDDEGYTRHLESRKHPDEDDLRKAVDFTAEHLQGIAEGPISCPEL